MGSPVSFARSEREQLCDLALELGPDAPTLCGDWTVRDLLVHLIVRESRPDGAPGILIPPLAGLTQRVSARVAERSFDDLVDDLRHPPRWSPSAYAAIDARLNAHEFFTHHEDIRRAQPDWAARGLSEADSDALWRPFGLLAKGLLRGKGVAVEFVRADTGKRVRAGEGLGPVTVTAPAGELLLFSYGREQVTDLTFEGDPAAVELLRAADLGI